jgi:hypothetical protein
MINPLLLSPKNDKRGGSLGSDETEDIAAYEAFTQNQPLLLGSLAKRRR